MSIASLPKIVKAQLDRHVVRPGSTRDFLFCYARMNMGSLPRSTKELCISTEDICGVSRGLVLLHSHIDLRRGRQRSWRFGWTFPRLCWLFNG